MLAILDFGHGFTSRPQHLPEQLRRESSFTFYLHKPVEVCDVAKKAEFNHIPTELHFEWRGERDIESNARVYRLSDVIKL